ncbi:MAG: triose-phosphate isomerase [Planctomycetota bacterium]|nr:MAG: triose-phosphate isomerase [Planctomycetota bacterium]
MQPLLVCGNWKMHTDRDGARALADGVLAQLEGSALGARFEVVLFPPFPFVADVAERLGDRAALACGGQNCHWEQEGAFTGEVSARMLASCGARWVLVGHSERRRVFGESDEEVGRRLRGALAAGLRPILCVGETLSEREAGRTTEVVAHQLRYGLEGTSAEQTARITIAYEPVWAIGTGRTASVTQAVEVHRAIRGLLPGPVAQQVRILYGGSVKPGNALELLSAPGIDGVLVGGASLDAHSFGAICRAAEQASENQTPVAGETDAPAQQDAGASGGMA